MSTVDLHIHSSVSDGVYTPTEVVGKAAGAGMTVIALADHDNVDGIAEALEAAEKTPGLKVIPGVEISTDVPDGEVHVLGYFIDHTHPELLSALATMRDSRQTRARKMIDKLAGLGFPVDWQRVQDLAGDGTIGRPHIAQALLEKGYISTFQEAFTRFLAWGGPAYVGRDKMTPQEAIILIRRAGGLAVLAHPFTSNNTESLVAGLKEGGLAGLEAYYKNYTTGEISTLVSLADKYGLIATGGTDYHGLDDKAETAIGGTNVPLKAAEELTALAGKRAL
ncbi:MAG: PHP domain-containing protein [Dehalococcoidales bacterium]